MQSNKKISGFTLIEVMAALAIIGFTLPALIGLGGSLMRTTSKATQGFDRIAAMVNFMYEAPEKAEKPGKKVTKEEAADSTHPVKLSYEKSPLLKKSSFADFNNLMIERVEARWQINNREMSDTLIRYVYSPKQD